MQATNNAVKANQADTDWLNNFVVFFEDGLHCGIPVRFGLLLMAFLISSAHRRASARMTFSCSEVMRTPVLRFVLCRNSSIRHVPQLRSGNVFAGMDAR